MTKVYYLTKEGLEKVRQEYDELTLYRKEILEDVPPILEGDSLNPEFSSFQENIELLEKRIEELFAPRLLLPQTQHGNNQLRTKESNDSDNKGRNPIPENQQPGSAYESNS